MRFGARSSGLAPWCAGALLAGAPLMSVVGAQTPARATIRATIVDTAGAPIVGAQFVLIRARSEAVQIARSDAAGRLAFAIEPHDTIYTVLVRKIGFTDLAGPLTLTAGDTAQLRITLLRNMSVAMLDTVRVEESRRVLSTDLHLSASDIAASTRPLLDGLDILAKLRPEMLGDPDKCVDPPGPSTDRLAFAPPPAPPRFRTPLGAQPLHVAPRVGTEHAIVQNLWINGEHVSLGGVPEMSPESLLVLIKPGDVEQIEYKGCYDNSMPLPGGRNALFVVLKPGYVFDYNRGTYFDSARVKSPR
jgi:carboxypeptidase family protein